MSLEIDLLPKLLHGTICNVDSVQIITVLLGADLTSLVSYYLYAIARDQQPNWRKKRREGEREKRRDPFCSLPSPLARNVLRISAVEGRLGTTHG